MKWLLVIELRGVQKIHRFPTVLMMLSACTDPTTKFLGTYHCVCATAGILLYVFVKASLFILELSVIAGTTVILGGVAVAMLGSRCNAVTVMVLNLAATPIELRYTQSLSCLLSSDSLHDHQLANSRHVTDSRNDLT